MCVLEDNYTRSFKDGMYGDLKKLLQHLYGLQHLQICLRYNGEPQHESGTFFSYDLCWGDLIPFTNIPLLKSMTFDLANVDWDLYSWRGHHIPRIHGWCPEDPLPFNESVFSNTLHRLTALQRIVAPQEAFFSCYPVSVISKDWNPVSLPPSLESIEIIDSTHALNFWARYVLRHRDEFPNLKRVVLWCNRNNTPLDDDGTELNYHNTKRDALDAGSGEFQDNEEWLFRGGVWDELQEGGVELVVNEKREQGWRQF